MQSNEILETRRRDVPQHQRDQQSSGIGVWSIVGGAALALLAAAIIYNFQDLKRYYKISTM